MRYRGIKAFSFACYTNIKPPSNPKSIPPQPENKDKTLNVPSFCRSFSSLLNGSKMSKMMMPKMNAKHYFHHRTDNFPKNCRLQTTVLLSLFLENQYGKIMPEISRFYGIVIYMYIDDHNPPHFHVWYEGYEAIVTIEDGIITGSLPRRALRLVYEWLDKHQEELMENWRLLSNSEAAKKIEPLK